jgi:SRSO17 transposase
VSQPSLVSTGVSRGGMAGQFSELERKSIEPIAVNITGGNIRAMQRFISVAEWDEDKISRKYRTLVNDDMGDPNGILIFDESGFVKKGSDSIGVARHRLAKFVWLSGVRWAIEQCFEETKTELGMDHYEVRKYSGWNHHILTCMLGHFFLWHLKIRLGEKNAVYYSVAA